MSSLEPSTAPIARRVAVLTATILVTLVFLGMVHGFLDVLFLAALIAGMARPLQRWSVELFNGRDGWAAGLTLIGLVLPGMAVVLFLVVVVLDQTQTVLRTAEPFLADLKDPQRGTERIQELLNFVPGAQHLEVSPKALRKLLADNAGELFTLIKSSASIGMNWVGVFSGMMGWWLLKVFVMLYATFFFLKEGSKIKAAIQQTVPLPKELKQRLVEKGVSVVRATLRGTLVVGLLQGALAGGAFWVVGLEGSAFWGVLVVFASLVPTVGTALVWVPIVLYLAFAGETTAAIGLTVWCAVVVGLADNILRPRLVGSDTKMPDLLILVSTLGGIGMFGPIGILLGPALAGVCVLMWDVFQQTFGDTYVSDQPAQDDASDETGMISA